LDRAVDLFWERGYYGVSVDELVKGTGLHRAAVYGEFGSRQRLFEASLRRYRERVVTPFFAELDRPDAGLTEVERFFSSIARAALGSMRRTGCLMVNTASEVSPRIRPVTRIVSRYCQELRALFRQACANARRRGELRPEIDVDQVADYLLGSVLGLWTLARSPAPPTALRHYVHGVLTFVDGLRSAALTTGGGRPRNPTRPSPRRRGSRA
jgi:TetR/AcrR family transcriptional repressor of nem operon